jgi:hypothetical protein
MSDAVIRSLAKWPGVQAIYLDERLCASGRCPTAHGELPLYSDIEHLSRDGAKILLSRPLSQLILYRPRNRIHHM